MNEKGIRLTGCAGKNAWKKEDHPRKKSSSAAQIKFLPA